MSKNAAKPFPRSQSLLGTHNRKLCFPNKTGRNIRRKGSNGWINETEFQSRHSQRDVGNEVNAMDMG